MKRTYHPSKVKSNRKFRFRARMKARGGRIVLKRRRVKGRIKLTISDKKKPYKNDLIKIGMDIDKNDYPEIEVIEVPVVKRMIFQFKKPVKLEFS